MQTSQDQFEELRQQEMAESQHKQEPLSKGLTLTGNNLLKMDMATIETIARSLVQQVRDGNMDALDLLVYAKKGAAFFKAIDDNVKEYAYAKQYATKGNPYNVHGCKVESSELGVKYSYSTEQDPIYADLLVKFETAKKAKEAREAFQKSIKGKLNFVDDDGVGHTIYELVKSGTMGYKVTVG